jgi:hypothetical protein
VAHPTCVKCFRVKQYGSPTSSRVALNSWFSYPYFPQPLEPDWGSRTALLCTKVRFIHTKLIVAEEEEGSALYCRPLIYFALIPELTAYCIYIYIYILILSQFFSKRAFSRWVSKSQFISYSCTRPWLYDQPNKTSYRQLMYLQYQARRFLEFIPFLIFLCTSHLISFHFSRCINFEKF